MAVVSVGNFQLTGDRKSYAIPADASADKTLYVVFNDVAVGAPAQHVRVVVTNTAHKVVSDKEYTVGLATPATVKLGKGTNLATILPGASGPCDQNIGFYLD